MKIVNRKFVCYFHRVPGINISLGVSISLSQPNLEIHIPFGFFRVGWQGTGLFSDEEFKKFTQKHGH